MTYLFNGGVDGDRSATGRGTGFGSKVAQHNSHKVAAHTRRGLKGHILQGKRVEIAEVTKVTCDTMERKGRWHRRTPPLA